jgi:two-component system, OmpR family, sensor kinase
MFSSVRIRLTLWYTVSMTIVLVVLAAAIYFFLSQNVIRRADANAIELADSFLLTVNAELSDATNPASVSDGIAAAISEHRFRDVSFLVYDANGNLLGASEGYSDPELLSNPSHEVLPSSLRPLVSSFETFRSLRIGRHQYRTYVRHFSVKQQQESLIVLQSLRRQKEFLETLVDTFWFVIPLAILLAGTGGYLLARRSLAPVVAMSSQASRIGAENLYQRLKVENPRDELGHLASSFNELLDRLSQSFEQQRRFVADASHELRTPVAILCGEAEVALAQQERTPREYRESLEILGQEAKRLKHIVEDLFTLARADAGQYPLALTDFYLDELVEECSRNVRTLAAARRIALSCQAQRELPIRADESLLRRMLLNLLDNAIKYTPEGGSVSLRCSEENGRYRLAVEDSGPGIPAEMQSRIFERFFRVDKARSRSDNNGSGGAGLGLAIALWIAGAHGGQLELTHSNPQGSMFTARLPKNAA